MQCVVTQNIDGLHGLAGTAPQRLVELHGTNALVECQSCHQRDDPEPHFDFFRRTRQPPLCRCGGFLKPATISFGQNLDPNELERAAQAAEAADLVIALGSTLVGLSCRFLSVASRAAGRALYHHQSRRDGARFTFLCDAAIGWCCRKPFFQQRLTRRWLQLKAEI